MLILHQFELLMLLNVFVLLEAIHWMDYERFYIEARRILKPCGVIAVYGYGNMELDKPDATQAVKQVL